MSLRNVVLGLPVLALLLAAGCGANAFEFLADKDSDVAKREAAQIAIDEGTPSGYAAAIAILEEACPPPDFDCPNIDVKDAKQLASAYMGEAGLDLLDFLDAAENLSDTGGEGSDFATISTILPDITADNLAAMKNAIDVLENIPKEERTDDLTLQLGMAQVTGAVIAIGVAGGETEEGYNDDGTPKFCGTGEDEDCSADEIDDNLTGDELIDIAKNITDGVANINEALSTDTDADTDTLNQTNDLIYNINNTNSTDSDDCSDSSGGTQEGVDAEVDPDKLRNYLVACL